VSDAYKFSNKGGVMSIECDGSGFDDGVESMRWQRDKVSAITQEAICDSINVPGPLNVKEILELMGRIISEHKQFVGFVNFKA